MSDDQTSAEQYVPTLREYAEVIEWLDRCRINLPAAPPLSPFSDVPEHLKRAYADAIQRAGFGRVAKAMQAAEDAGDDGEGRSVGKWEPCDEDGCWDFAFVTEGHHERTFWTILELARAVNAWRGENAALLAWSGRWDKAYLGLSPMTDELGPCDEDGESLIETDDDGMPVAGFRNIRPATWVTMDPDVADPRADGPLRMRVSS